MVSNSHQGWSNYETWCVNLGLANEEQTYRRCQSLATEAREHAETCPQVRDNVWTFEEAPTFLLADALKEFVEDGNPLASQSSMYSDLLTAALSEVNWHEIAEAFLKK